jgi:hypothetical protein
VDQTGQTGLLLALALVLAARTRIPNLTRVSHGSGRTVGLCSHTSKAGFRKNS